jgi:hypothetical protein
MVVKPPIFRLLFLLNALFPNAVAREFRRLARKSPADGA